MGVQWVKKKKGKRGEEKVLPAPIVTIFFSLQISITQRYHLNASLVTKRDPENHSYTYIFST